MSLLMSLYSLMERFLKCMYPAVRLTNGCAIFAYKILPLSMEFSRQEYGSKLPFPSPGDVPNLGIEPASPELQADSLPTEPLGKPKILPDITKYLQNAYVSFQT